jgi:hypothetical protein
LQLWADFYNPDSYVAHQLVRHALATIAQRSAYQPIYVGVCDYHGSLGALLSDYGFAPITDRAKMVRPVMQWVRGLTMEPSMILKPTAPVIGAPFVLPTPPEITLPRYGSRSRPSPARALMAHTLPTGTWLERNGKDIVVRHVGVHAAAQALAQATAQADVVSVV